MLRDVLVLTYYTCVARTVIGLVYILNKARSYNTIPIPVRTHQDIFWDVRMFFMSVVQHSPVFEHMYGYHCLWEFWRSRYREIDGCVRSSFPSTSCDFVCRSVLPSSFPTPILDLDVCEYSFRMVCPLWVFSCFSPVKLWYTSGLPGDLSSGEATSSSRQSV